MGYRIWAMGYGLWAMGYRPPGTLTIAGSLSMSVRSGPATRTTKLALELNVMDNNSAQDTILPICHEKHGPWDASAMGRILLLTAKAETCVKRFPPCSSVPVPQCTCALECEPSYGYYWHASHLHLRGSPVPS